MDVLALARDTACRGRYKQAGSTESSQSASFHFHIILDHLFLLL